MRPKTPTRSATSLRVSSCPGVCAVADPQYGAAHRARRRAWEVELARLGAISCGCGCGQTIRHGDTWHLGHGVAHIHGGDGADSTPWTITCNARDGQRIGDQRKRVPASRDW